MSEQNTVDAHFNYIIVGGGIAGITCAEHLYILDPGKEVLLLTANNIVKTVSDVVPLTKYLDSFSVKEKSTDNIKLQSPSVIIQKDAVTKLYSTEKIVVTSSGKKYKYDKLCICTGAVPKTIDSTNPLVLGIRDTETVLDFQRKIQKAKRIVIVGNGGIATEMVYELEGVEVIWAIKDTSPNAVFMDPGAAEFLRPMMNDKEGIKQQTVHKRHRFAIDDEVEKSGKFTGESLGPDWHAGLLLKGEFERKVVLETQVEVKKILNRAEFISKYGLDSGDWPVYVELTNGKQYGCDFIVSATGVIPNVSQFLEGNEFKLCDDGGLLIDEKMETSVLDVFSAGDSCTANWDIGKHWFQRRLWTQARQMGSYAAKCMWSSSVSEEIYMDFCFEFFAHSTKFFGMKVILLGLFNGQKLDNQYEVLLRMTRGLEYIKCIIVDGKIQGAVLIGETDLEETFENLILNQIDISFLGADLLNPNVDIDDYFD